MVTQTKTVNFGVHYPRDRKNLWKEGRQLAKSLDTPWPEYIIDLLKLELSDPQVQTPTQVDRAYKDYQNQGLHLPVDKKGIWEAAKRLATQRNQTLGDLVADVLEAAIKSGKS